MKERDGEGTPEQGLSMEHQNVKNLTNFKKWSQTFWKQKRGQKPFSKYFTEQDFHFFKYSQTLNLHD